MKKLFIKNAYIISMNSKREIFDGGGILIHGDRIVAVGRVDEESIGDAEVLDAKGKIILPGFINTHVHLSQQLGRGIADDVDLLTWLQKRVWPYESNLSYEDSYISSLACCIELIRSGVTTFLEAGGQHVEAMVKAVDEIGLRGCLTKSVMDRGEGLPKVWEKTTSEELLYEEELIKKYHNTSNSRIKIWCGLRTIFNNSDELILKTKKLADKYSTGIHMHVGEVPEEIDFSKKINGSSTVAHLDQLGVLDKNFLAVHTVWLTPEEIQIFKERDVKVSHNPAAAMKVTLGFAKIPEMLDIDIPVSIGTDGAPSNNRMDIMRDMYLTSLIHKGRTLDSKVVSAEKVLEMATINGAKCALMEESIGSLEVGKKADLIILEADDIHCLPLHNPVGNIVYSMTNNNIISTMCNGRWLMKDRKVLTVDEDKIIKMIKKHGDEIKEKASINIGSTFKTIKI